MWFWWDAPSIRKIPVALLSLFMNLRLILAGAESGITTALVFPCLTVALEVTVPPPLTAPEK